MPDHTPVLVDELLLCLAATLIAKICFLELRLLTSSSALLCFALCTPVATFALILLRATGHYKLSLGSEYLADWCWDVIASHPALTFPLPILSELDTSLSLEPLQE